MNNSELKQNEKTSVRYMNQYAMLAALCMPQNFIGVLGRASAKTTQFQVTRLMQAVQECPGSVLMKDAFSRAISTQ